MTDKSESTKNTQSSRAEAGKPEVPRDPFSVQGKEVEASLRRAVNRALLTHKQVGNSIAVWRDGKVAIIPAEEISVPDVLRFQLRVSLSKDLHSMGESLQRVFDKMSEEEPLAWAAATPQEEARKVWEWQDPDATHAGTAFHDSNGDLQVLFSSEEMSLQGMRLRLSISSAGGKLEHEREVALRRMSETEVGALFVITRYEWPSEGARVSLDLQEVKP